MAREGLPERRQAFTPMSRAVVADQVLGGPFSREGVWPWANIWVDAPAQNLDAILLGELLVVSIGPSSAPLRVEAGGGPHGAGLSWWKGSGTDTLPRPC
jgi:hypothetical protein